MRMQPTGPSETHDAPASSRHQRFARPIFSRFNLLHLTRREESRRPRRAYCRPGSNRPRRNCPNTLLFDIGDTRSRVAPLGDARLVRSHARGRGPSDDRGHDPGHERGTVGTNDFDIGYDAAHGPRCRRRAIRSSRQCGDVPRGPGSCRPSHPRTQPERHRRTLPPTLNGITG